MQEVAAFYPAANAARGTDVASHRYYALLIVDK